MIKSREEELGETKSLKKTLESLRTSNSSSPSSETAKATKLATATSSYFKAEIGVRLAFA